MKDEILRVSLAEGSFRLLLVRSSQVLEKARHLHGLYPTSLDALGRVISASLLMAQTLKHKKDSLTIRVMGDGPLGPLVGVADLEGRVRAYVDNPHLYMPKKEGGKFAFAQAVGFGSLSVSKDLGYREPYVGTVPLTSGEIAADITEYYASSEQTATACGLGVYVKEDQTVGASGGFLLQRLPQADEELVAAVEGRLATLPSLSTFLYQGHSLKDLVKVLAGDLAYKILEKKTPRFACPCSKEKYGRALSLLSKEDLVDMIEEDQGAETVCRFCSTRYYFNKVELEALLQGKEA